MVGFIPRGPLLGGNPQQPQQPQLGGQPSWQWGQTPSWVPDWLRNLSASNTAQEQKTQADLAALPPRYAMSPRDLQIAMSLGMTGGGLKADMPAVPSPEGLTASPEVPKGMTRLTRVEPIAESGTVPDWLKESDAYKGIVNATGRWFTADQPNIDWYVQHTKAMGLDPKLTYLDVPTADVEQYRVSNLPPEIQQFSRRPDEEFFLPKDLAGQRQPLVPASGGLKADMPSKPRAQK